MAITFKPRKPTAPSHHPERDTTPDPSAPLTPLGKGEATNNQRHQSHNPANTDPVAENCHLKVNSLARDSSASFLDRLRQRRVSMRHLVQLKVRTF